MEKETDKKTKQEIDDIKLDLTKTQRESFLSYIRAGVPLNKALKKIHLYTNKFYFWKKLAEDIETIKSNDYLSKKDNFYGEKGEVENTKLVQTLKKNKSYAHEIVEFINDYDEAQTEFISQTIGHLKQADKGEWQKFAWLLERVSPQDFGKKDPDKQEEQKKVSRIKVEYVDSNKDKDRLEAMEKIVQEEVLGKRDDK